MIISIRKYEIARYCAQLRIHSQFTKYACYCIYELFERNSLFSRCSIVAFRQIHNLYMYSPSCPVLIVTFLSRNVLIGNRCRSICPIYYARDFLICTIEHCISYSISTFHYVYVCLCQHKGKHQRFTQGKTDVCCLKSFVPLVQF